MARNDRPDHEMERRLMEHFSEEARELRAPDDLWERLEGRLGPQQEPRFAFLRNWTMPTGARAWVPAAAAALLVVVVGLGIWGLAGGGDADDGEGFRVAAPAATAAPTPAPATPFVVPATAATAAPTPTPIAVQAAIRTPTPAPTAAPTAAPAATAAATATPAATAAPTATSEPTAAPDRPADASEREVSEPEAPSEGEGIAEGEAEAMPSGEGGAEEPAPAAPAAEDIERQQATLSAGEVDDNERWDEYVHYRNQYAGSPIHVVDVTERYVITVSDSEGRPVHNARVRVSTGDTPLFEGRTYANGQTLFFPRAFAGSEGAESFTLSVEKDGAGERLQLARDGELEWDVSLDLDQSAPDGGVPLDILFLLDSMGSMEDEIDQIKDTLLSISSRISDLPSQPDLRFGMVAYRDRGDEFVTRVYDFEPDAVRFLDTIRGVVAAGGDDYPESLNEALHVAVHEPDWRREDAIRLMFLIADAPPHLDYEQDYSYADEMIEAHRRGIKIFAIASSGLDEQGEYVFRQIAQHTMGRFIFIVYGEGGTTPHSVGEYTVERLDDLVVSLVQEELAFLER